MSRRSRRSFLKAVPVTVGAAVAVPAAAQDRITKEVLECGETLTGVDFEPAESDLMLNLANTNREHYDAIRRVPLPPETEPAFSFRLSRPGISPDSEPRRSPRVERGRGSKRGGGPQTEARIIGGASRLEDVAFASAATLGQLIAARHITSLDLTRMYLDRLKRLDGRLQCVITLTEALALEQAEHADAELKAGRSRGPLHGVPYGIKDLFATRGIRTTWGAKPYEDQVFDYDSTTVERLREAGAVLVAKLTTGELAIGDLWFGGRTRNPWNPDTGANGSSAGPAAAVAAGLVGFAIGTETGGSIVSPASTCGVAGLRPTYGRISRHGVMTLRWTLDKVGPIARTIEDCALVLQAIHGPDGRDETVVDLPLDWTPEAGLEGMRLGYVEQEFEGPPDSASAEERARWPARRAALAAALEVFRAAGARLAPIALPELPAQSLYSILNAEAGAMFDDLVRSGRVRQLAGKLANHRANQLRAARYIPAVEYIRAQRVRTLLIAQMNALFNGVDAFLAPPSSASVTMTNLTGHPALVLKAGFVDDMPEAIMVTGRLFDEGTILRIAHAYEAATPWKDRHPRLSTGVDTRQG
jgi:Asp-tRNA(Asn)/Glu-tRNA(Gln) amidotransferase A subunit family amidase